MTLIQVPVPLPISWDDTAAAISIAANATASGSVTSPGGAASTTIQLTGTWVGTVQLQISLDGVHYLNVTADSIMNMATAAVVTGGNITANAIYVMNTPGIVAARVITTAYTSGTIVGILSISPAVATSNVTVSGTTTINGTPTMLQGVTASTAGTLPLGYNNKFAGGSGAAVASTIRGSGGGRSYQYAWYNPNTTVCYLQFFVTATPTVGTTTPVVMIPLAPQSFNVLNWPYGVAFTGALTAAVTTTNTGGTAPALPVDVTGIIC